MATRKPGKYDHVFPKLPKLPPEDLDYQQRVEDVKKSLRLCAHCNGSKDCGHCNGSGRRQLTGSTIAKLYVTMREHVEFLAREMSDANLRLEAASQMLMSAHESGDTDFGSFGASDRSLKLTNGDTLRVQPEVYPVAKDKAAFREWCYANGFRNKLELPVKPMTDLAKSRLLNGETEPTGMTIYVRSKIVYTRLKTMTQTEPSDDNSRF